MSVFEANPKIVEFLRESGALLICRELSATATRIAGDAKIRLSFARRRNGSSRWMPTPRPATRSRFVLMHLKRSKKSNGIRPGATAAWAICSKGVPIGAFRVSGSGACRSRSFIARVATKRSPTRRSSIMSPISLQSKRRTHGTHGPKANCCPMAINARNATVPTFAKRPTFSTYGSIRVRAALRCSKHRGDTLRFPADVYLEGGDQYRGWFNSSLSCGIAAHDRAPYKQIITHGWVVDGEGKNDAQIARQRDGSPNEIIDKSVPTCCVSGRRRSITPKDVRCSDEILERVVDAYRKFRNTLRYALGNLADFDPAADSVSPDDMRGDRPVGAG